MFLTLFGLMEVKAVRCVLWQKLRRLLWGCVNVEFRFSVPLEFEADSGEGYSPALFSMGHARVIWSPPQPAIVWGGMSAHTVGVQFDAWRHLLVSLGSTSCQLCHYGASCNSTSQVGLHAVNYGRPFPPLNKKNIYIFFFFLRIEI